MRSSLQQSRHKRADLTGALPEERLRSHGWLVLAVLILVGTMFLQQP